MSNKMANISIQDIEFVYEMLVLSSYRQQTCIIYGTDPNMYTQVRKRVPSGGILRDYAHRIALKKKIKMTKLENGVEASHLCHTKGCINPDHLSAEPHGINMNRIACYNETKVRGHHMCFGHGAYPSCL